MLATIYSFPAVIDLSQVRVSGRCKNEKSGSADPSFLIAWARSGFSSPAFLEG